MKQDLQRRLQELSAEMEAGKKLLADLEARVATIKQTLARLAGAIQVIEKELENSNS
jgi:predicted nuclease with TOPRIM domain